MSVTYNRSVVSSLYSGFMHLKNLQPLYGGKFKGKWHLTPIIITLLHLNEIEAGLVYEPGTSFSLNLLLTYYIWYVYTVKFFCEFHFKLLVHLFQTKLLPSEHVFKHVWWVHQILEGNSVRSYVQVHLQSKHFLSNIRR